MRLKEKPEIKTITTPLLPDAVIVANVAGPA